MDQRKCNIKAAETGRSQMRLYGHNLQILMDYCCPICPFQHSFIDALFD